MQLQPDNTSVGDLCTAALRECGAFGLGQTPTGDDISDAWARMQWMLQQWQRKSWLVYQLKTFSILATGAISYSVGAGAQIDLGTGTQRPAKIEFCYARQQNNLPNPIDYPCELLQSKVDYDRIALKNLATFPQYAFYDPALPFGNLFVWPVPSSIYTIFITLLAPFQRSYATAATVVTFPDEYYAAILYNLAMRLRSRYNIPTYPGDMLPGLARDSLEVLRTSNAGIARLVMPAEIGRPGIYNIFSDQMY